jgi:hypothetical protein
MLKKEREPLEWFGTRRAAVVIITLGCYAPDVLCTGIRDGGGSEQGFLYRDGHSLGNGCDIYVFVIPNSSCVLVVSSNQSMNE